MKVNYKNLKETKTKGGGRWDGEEEVPNLGNKIRIRGDRKYKELNKEEEKYQRKKDRERKREKERDE